MICRRIAVPAFASAVCLSAFLPVAGDDYHDMCTNMVAALYDDCRITDPAFTNLLYSFSQEASGCEKASVDVVLSVSLFKMFEKSIDDNAMRLCRELCTNVVSSAELPLHSWQKSAACAVYATTLAMDSQYAAAYSTCTNAIAVHLSSPVSEDESAVWSGISHCHFADGLSVTNALNLCAALSILIADPLGDCASYTNGLPMQALQKVMMAVGD